MRRTGFGVFYDYDDIRADQLVLRPDGKRVAAFWVSKRKEDRYDDDTIYEVAEWDPATRKQLESYTHVHSANLQSGVVAGRPLREVRYDPGGKLLMVFDDGSTKPARPPILDEIPPWERREQQGG